MGFPFLSDSAIPPERRVWARAALDYCLTLNLVSLFYARSVATTWLTRASPTSPQQWCEMRPYSPHGKLPTKLLQKAAELYYFFTANLDRNAITAASMLTPLATARLALAQCISSSSILFGQLAALTEADWRWNTKAD